MPPKSVYRIVGITAAKDEADDEDDPVDEPGCCSWEETPPVAARVAAEAKAPDDEDRGILARGCDRELFDGVVEPVAVRCRFIAGVVLSCCCCCGVDAVVVVERCFGVEKGVVDADAVDETLLLLLLFDEVVVVVVEGDGDGGTEPPTLALL